jgi:hypothetical protein
MASRAEHQHAEERDQQLGVRESGERGSEDFASTLSMISMFLSTRSARAWSSGPFGYPMAQCLACSAQAAKEIRTPRDRYVAGSRLRSELCGRSAL